jgi:glycosyltransferase involved in cell wall biosynthesis
MTLTRPFVACGSVASRPSTAPNDVPVSVVSPMVWRLPQRYRRRARGRLIAAIGRRRGARLLHAHFGYWATETAAAASRLRLPWVISLHGYDVLVMARRVAEPDRARAADLVVVPSRFLAAAAVAAGYPEDRIRVIPSGLDVDAYPYRSRGPRADGSVHVVFAGRFAPKKGVIDAARAMAIADERDGAPLVCTFVGYGPQEAELRAELDRSRLDASIIDGRRTGAVTAALDAADLLVTASRTAPDGDAESLGLVNLEGQLCGLPVVSTRHGAIPEAVSAAGAVLVAEGDVVGLAAAIRDLADHPERWPAMGAAGHDHVRRHFRLTDKVREVEECYLELLA